MASGRKKLKVDEVTDDQGRRRFHGAFTGGFSAGYYNTAGSAEGWAPSNYKSSKASRAVSSRQRAQDYMDAEDGIFNSSLERSEEYDTFGHKTDKKIAAGAAALGMGNIIPGPAPSELIVASTKAIGKKLLATMGWKEGQGLGPRVRTKRTSIVPSGINYSAIPAAANANGIVTLAPDNTRTQISVPVAKSNMHGIGYFRTSLDGGLDIGEGVVEKRGVYRMDVSLLKKGTTMQAPGLYRDSNYVRDSAGFACSDDVDDVYDDAFGAAYTNAKNMEEVPIDYVEEDSALNKKRCSIRTAVDKFVGDTAGEGEFATERCSSDNRAVLEGFVLAKALQEIPNFYPPIIVPSDFKPYHVFNEDKKEGERAVGVPYKRHSKEKRAELLSKGALIDADDRVVNKMTNLIDSSTSVFSLLDDCAREKIKAALQSHEPQSNNNNYTIDVSATAGLRRAVSTEGDKQSTAVDKRPMLVNSSVSASVFAGVSAAFKSRFASASSTIESNSSNASQECATHQPVGLWRVEKKQLDDEKKCLIEIPPSVSRAQLTSGITKTGSSNRTTEIWKPHPLLCKRMGVPVPAVSKDITPYGQPSGTKEHQSIGEMVGGTDFDDRFRSDRSVVDNLSGPSREDELYQKHIGQHITNNIIHDAASNSRRYTEAQEIEDVVKKLKPPKSLFKSIFEPGNISSESSSESSDSESESSFNDRSRLKGPTLPTETALDPTRDFKLAENEQTSHTTIGLPAKIVFKKPVSASGNISGRHGKSIPSSSLDTKTDNGPIAEPAVRNSRLSKHSGLLSFAGEFDNELTTYPAPIITEDIQEAAVAANLMVSDDGRLTSSSSGSDSSSNDDSDDDKDLQQRIQHFGSPSALGATQPAAVFNIDADSIKAKLKGLLEKSSNDKRHKKTSQKKSKKENKSKKQKKESKSRGSNKDSRYREKSEHKKKRHKKDR